MGGFYLFCGIFERFKYIIENGNFDICVVDGEVGVVVVVDQVGKF